MVAVLGIVPPRRAGTSPMRREIVRALRAIGEKKVRLSPDGALRIAAKRAMAVDIPAAAVEAMVSEGLVARSGEDVRRTAEGRAFLRRALASLADEPYRAQHQVVVPRTVSVPDGETEVRVNAAESPLQWLATRKGKGGSPLVDKWQLEAGERLARDYERSHLRERVTQSWDASGVRGTARRDGLTANEAACAARRRVEKALEAVGPGLADALVAVCCDELGLEATEKRLGWPVRSGKVVLAVALDRLAEHYGIARLARGTGANLVHWGTDDYRPRA